MTVAKVLADEKSPQVSITIKNGGAESTRKTLTYDNCYARQNNPYSPLWIYCYADGPNPIPRGRIDMGIVVMVEHTGNHGDTFKHKEPQKAPEKPAQEPMSDDQAGQLMDDLLDRMQPPVALPAGNYVAEVPVYANTSASGGPVGVARIRPAIPPTAEVYEGDVKKKRGLPRRLPHALTAMVGSVPANNLDSSPVAVVSTASAGKQIVDTPTMKAFNQVDSDSEEPAIGDDQSSSFSGDEKVYPPGFGLARRDVDSPSGFRAALEIIRGPKKEVLEVRDGKLVPKPVLYRPSGSSLVRRDMGHRGGSWLKQKIRLFTRMIFIPAALAFMMLGASYGPHSSN